MEQTIEKHTTKEKTIRKKDVWYPVDQHPELLMGKYIVPNFSSNSIALKILGTQASTDEFLIISPGVSLLKHWKTLGFTAQAKAHIIMPNAYHYMGVSAWQKAFPNNTLYASQSAIPRLISKGIAKQGGIISLENQLPPLPENYSILFPPGHRAGDVWLKKEMTNESLWVTCDSFLNHPKMSNQPIARLMQRLLGAAPGLKMSQVVKWLILNDKKAFKIWALNQLSKDNPTVLIPSHGEITHDKDLASQIQKMIQERL